MVADFCPGASEHLTSPHTGPQVTCKAALGFFQTLVPGDSRVHDKVGNDKGGGGGEADDSGTVGGFHLLTSYSMNLEESSRIISLSLIHISEPTRHRS